MSAQEPVRLVFTGTEGAQDITNMQESIVLSGDLDSCCRTLRLKHIVSDADPNLPYVFISLGGVLELYVGDAQIFRGVVFSKSKSTDGSTMDVTAFDFGYYLKNNVATYRFDGETADSITQTVCSRFGVPIWSLAAPGVPIRRRFNSLPIYKIIDTAYTMSSEQTGKQYVMRFRGAALQIVERAESGGVLVAPGVNLISASYAQSAEDMVNHIAIIDADGVTQELIQDLAAVRLHGMLHREIKAEKDRDAAAEARQMLETHKLQDTCSVTILGDASIMTGDTITLREPYTGQNGTFWVDGDTHTWKKGYHTTKLKLSYRAGMREGEAGQELED